MVELSKEESLFLYLMILDYERIIGLSLNPNYQMSKSDFIKLKNKLFKEGFKNVN
jgi:hypothetical protein